jgi:hypothetical protein
MSKSKKLEVAGVPEIDPTLPKVGIKLGDTTYYLCYTFGAMALAEARLRKQGIECNLLKGCDVTSLDASTLSSLLYAGLLTHQPDITIEHVLGMITFHNMFFIPNRITEAYVASLALPSEDDGVATDPTQPDV